MTRPLRSATSLLRRIVLGRPLANQEHEQRQIGAIEGLAAMGLDGLASSAYGPEAALTILIPLGAASLSHVFVVMGPILALLGLLYLSYWQTIGAYPSNGGAYTVSKENLGVNVSLLAAAALMIDYVLNVAVAISAGVAALVSALPFLHPYTLPLCFAILAIITFANLHGTSDTSRLFAVPTYLFVASFLAVLAIGIGRTILAGGAPQPIVPPPPLGAVTEGVTLWLLLRAFAAGCTAMTGVEAVSNGVSAFREPRVTSAHRTLTLIVLVLGALLAGISILVKSYQIGAMDQSQEGYQSVLSQLAAAVVGRGWLYGVAIGSLLCVLALSANTSFTGFPRLCRLVAQDGFLPRPFALVGRRLVSSVGILYLAATAGLLLFAFGGITDRLIPLFAIGAFLTFSLSQIGMVVHWRRELRRSGARRIYSHLAVNATGAAATVLALGAIIVAKFTEGAWITLLVIPLVIVLLKSIRHYYDLIDSQMRDERRLDLTDSKPPIVVIPTQGWNRLTDEALRFALTISPEVIAVHFVAAQGPDGPENEEVLRARWAEQVAEPARRAGLQSPKLLVEDAPYRLLHAPLLKLVEKLHRDRAGRVVAVLLPEIVQQRWWQRLLHTRRVNRIKAALLCYGEAPLVVMTIPWRLDQPEVEPELEDQQSGDSGQRPHDRGLRSRPTAQAGAA